MTERREKQRGRPFTAGTVAGHLIDEFRQLPATRARRRNTMKAPPKVLQPRQQQRRTQGYHQPDHALDLLIAAHRRKHGGRLAMLDYNSAGRLARHLNKRITNTIARRF